MSSYEEVFALPTISIPPQQFKESYLSFHQNLEQDRKAADKDLQKQIKLRKAVYRELQKRNRQEGKLRRAKISAAADEEFQNFTPERKPSLLSILLPCAIITSMLIAMSSLFIRILAYLEQSQKLKELGHCKPLLYGGLGLFVWIFFAAGGALNINLIDERIEREYKKWGAVSELRSDWSECDLEKLGGLVFRNKVLEGLSVRERREAVLFASTRRFMRESLVCWFGVAVVVTVLIPFVLGIWAWKLGPDYEAFDKHLPL